MDLTVAIAYALIAVTFMVSVAALVSDQVSTNEIPTRTAAQRKQGTQVFAWTDEGRVWTDRVGELTGTFNANFEPIINVAPPQQFNDAATKEYVDKTRGAKPGGVEGSVQFFGDNDLFEGDARLTYQNGLLSAPVFRGDLAQGRQANITGLGAQLHDLVMNGRNVQDAGVVTADRLDGPLGPGPQPGVTGLGVQAQNLDLGGHALANASLVAATTLQGQLASGPQDALTGLGQQARDLDMGGFRVVRAAPPQDPQDLVTLQYLQQNGASAAKAPNAVSFFDATETPAVSADLTYDDAGKTLAVPQVQAKVTDPVQTQITQLGVLSAPLQAGGQQLKNVADPTDPGDAVSRGWLEARAPPGTAGEVPYHGPTGEWATDAGFTFAGGTLAAPQTTTQLTAGVQAGVTGLGAQAQNLNMSGHQVVGLPGPTQDDHAATKLYVDDAARVPGGAGQVTWSRGDGTAGADPTFSFAAGVLRAPRFEGTVATGAQPEIVSVGTQQADLDMGSNYVRNVRYPAVPSDAATMQYVLDQNSAEGGEGAVQYKKGQVFAGEAAFTYDETLNTLTVPRTATTLAPGNQTGVTGLGAQSIPLNMNGQRVTNVPAPLAGTDAVSRDYVDGRTTAGGSTGSVPYNDGAGAYSYSASLTYSEGTGELVAPRLNGLVSSPLQPGITALGPQTFPLNMNGQEVQGTSVYRGGEVDVTTLRGNWEPTADLDMGGRYILNCYTDPLRDTDVCNVAVAKTLGGGGAVAQGNIYELQYNDGSGALAANPIISTDSIGRSYAREFVIQDPSLNKQVYLRSQFFEMTATNGTVLRSNVLYVDQPIRALQL